MRPETGSNRQLLWLRVRGQLRPGAAAGNPMTRAAAIGVCRHMTCTRICRNCQQPRTDHNRDFTL